MEKLVFDAASMLLFLLGSMRGHPEAISRPIVILSSDFVAADVTDANSS
jgi:hypothetical protein